MSLSGYDQKHVSQGTRELGGDREHIHYTSSLGNRQTKNMKFPRKPQYVSENKQKAVCLLNTGVENVEFKVDINPN